MNIGLGATHCDMRHFSSMDVLCEFKNYCKIAQHSCKWLTITFAQVLRRKKLIIKKVGEKIWVENKGHIK